MNSDVPYKFVAAGLSLDDFYKQRKVKAEKILNILQCFTSNLDTKSLLDIGCHEGTITKYLAPSFLSTTGVDIDSETIDIAQKLNDKNINFITYDGEILPFKDNAFDVLVVNHVIYYVQNQNHFLSEINRVLKPDGICYLSAINILFVESSFIPNNLWKSVRRKLLKSADNFGHPCSYNQYLEMFDQFRIKDFTLQLMLHPHKHAADIIGWQKIILLALSKLPIYALKKLVKLSPTYIFILFKPKLTESRGSTA